MILTRRDTTTDWNPRKSQANQVRGGRVCLHRKEEFQNWRGDVGALLTDSDGTFDEVDINDFFAALNIDDGECTLGRGVLHSDLYANRRGYAGYEYDPAFQSTGQGAGYDGRNLLDAASRNYINCMADCGITIGQYQIEHRNKKAWRRRHEERAGRR